MEISLEDRKFILDIGRTLRRYRRGKKISKNKMSILAGISEKTIVNLEHGYGVPRIATLLKVMQVLNLKFNFYEADEWLPLDEDLEYEETGWGSMAIENNKEARQIKKAKLAQAELDRIEAEKSLVSPGAEVEDEDLDEANFFGPGEGIPKKKVNPLEIDTSGDEELPVF